MGNFTDICQLQFFNQIRYIHKNLIEKKQTKQNNMLFDFVKVVAFTFILLPPSGFLVPHWLGLNINNPRGLTFAGCL